MKLIGLVKQITPPIAVQAVRRLLGRGHEGRIVRNFLRQGAVPWSGGYDVYRRQLLTTAVSDPFLLARFRNGEDLPPAYGVGVDERCVEYPWLFADWPAGAERVLDAGSTLNHEFVLDRMDLAGRRLHILTLAPEENCYWRRGISYLFGDLRDIPIRDGYYDAVVCLSTLEHVGCDNAGYSHTEAHREARPEDFVPAMREIRRVLRSKGTLWLTVPFGTYRKYRTFQQFDRALLSRAVEAFAPAERAESFFRYTANGWVRATDRDCAGCEYVTWVASAAQGWPSPIPVEPDRAAAARAVACVRLVKE
jgi:SAM-dependent methyltransferase